MSIMYSHTLGHDVDLSVDRVDSATLASLMQDLYPADSAMAPGIRRDLLALVGRSTPCQFCGSTRRVKQYLSVQNAVWPCEGDIQTSRVFACHDCTNPDLGGGVLVVAPQTATL